MTDLTLGIQANDFGKQSISYTYHKNFYFPPPPNLFFSYSLKSAI